VIPPRVCLLLSLKTFLPLFHLARQSCPNWYVSAQFRWWFTPLALNRRGGLYNRSSDL
jgi:hypothetical protein